MKEHLGDEVKIAPYEDIFEHVRVLGEGVDPEKGEKVFVSNKTSWALTLSLGDEKVVEGITQKSPYSRLPQKIVSTSVRSLWRDRAGDLAEFFPSTLSLHSSLPSLSSSHILTDFSQPQAAPQSRTQKQSRTKLNKKACDNATFAMAQH